jgi:hypothetical protein
MRMELPLADGPIVPGLPEACGPAIDGPAGINGLDKPMRREDRPEVARIPLTPTLVLGFLYLLGLDSSEDKIQNFRSGLPFPQKKKKNGLPRFFCSLYGSSRTSNLGKHVSFPSRRLFDLAAAFKLRLLY